MTLYELLHKVSFDEIAPFLSKSYAEGRSLAWFKMHYDYLRHLVPQQNEHNDKILFHLPLTVQELLLPHFCIIPFGRVFGQGSGCGR